MNIVPPKTGYSGFAGLRTPITGAMLQLFGVLGGLAFLGGFYWFFYLLWTSPDAPAAAAEQVAEMSNHGRRFYVREAEAVLFYVLSIGGFCVAIFAMMASMAIFGIEAEQRTLAGRVLGIVWTILIVLGMAVVGTGGHFPFAMVLSR